MVLVIRYQQRCQHYEMESTRNNCEESRKNGAIESPHGHLKKGLRQALLLHGSNNFESAPQVQSYHTGQMCPLYCIIETYR
jgi:hypothetical protein